MCVFRSSTPPLIACSAERSGRPVSFLFEINVIRGAMERSDGRSDGGGRQTFAPPKANFHHFRLMRPRVQGSLMFRWFEKLRRGKNGQGAERELTGADIAAEFLARAGTEDRADRLPAWALLLRSPYETSRTVSSWLGGAPHAPRDFNWPNDVDGTPLHFLAQIDLASLKPEPETGARPPGLPEDGALLVFGGQSYACRILDARYMVRAGPLALPGR